MNTFDRQTDIVSTHTITRIEHYWDNNGVQHILQRQVLVAVTTNGELREWKTDMNHWVVVGKIA